MHGVTKQPEKNVDVKFTSISEHVGKGSVTLAPFLDLW